MKITINDGITSVTVERDATYVNEAMELCLDALKGLGYIPLNIHESLLYWYNEYQIYNIESDE